MVDSTKSSAVPLFTHESDLDPYKCFICHSIV
jgi:hypothetical protein